MTQKEMLQKMLNTLEEVNGKISAIDKRVTALEKGKKPTNSGKGSSTAKVVEKEATKAKYSTNIKDYEPKKDANGHYIWVSYKAKRKDYCYASATNGKTLGCYEKGKKVCDFEEIAEEFNLAKEKFNKKFPYTKKADR